MLLPVLLLIFICVLPILLLELGSHREWHDYYRERYKDINDKYCSLLRESSRELSDQRWEISRLKSEIRRLESILGRQQAARTMDYLSATSRMAKLYDGERNEDNPLWGELRDILDEPPPE